MRGKHVARRLTAAGGQHILWTTTGSSESSRNPDRRNIDRGQPSRVSEPRREYEYRIRSCGPSSLDRNPRACSVSRSMPDLASRIPPCKPGSRDSRFQLAGQLLLRTWQSRLPRSIHHSPACSRRSGVRLDHDRNSRAQPSVRRDDCFEYLLLQDVQRGRAHEVFAQDRPVQTCHRPLVFRR